MRWKTVLDIDSVPEKMVELMEKSPDSAPIIKAKWSYVELELSKQELNYLRAERFSGTNITFRMMTQKGKAWVVFQTYRKSLKHNEVIYKSCNKIPFPYPENGSGEFTFPNLHFYTYADDEGEDE